MMKISRYFLLTILIFSASAAMAIQEPAYRSLISEPPFEHRAYSGYVVAETEISGDFDAASTKGFRRVAAYIFGENSLPNGDVKKIAMTAPVTVEAKSSGWRLHFVMPDSENLDSLPKPKNAEVHLRKVAAHQMAVIRFSGWTTKASIEEQTEKLKVWIGAKNLKIAGPPQVARYDDPFTLPWRRRNEIMIPVLP
jgi:hypothetical protein